jgi:hypothetical protein
MDTDSENAEQPQVENAEQPQERPNHHLQRQTSSFPDHH